MIALRGFAVALVLILPITACSASETSDSAVTETPNAGADTSPDTESTVDEAASADQPFFAGTLGEPANGFEAPVDLAVRPGNPPLSYVVEQGGTIRRMEPDGGPGPVVADLGESTRADGEQGLLGLAFDAEGTVAYANYTDRRGDTVVEAFDVDDTGTFDMASRRTVYTLSQPYANHNGGELLLSPDGGSLLIFTGDGGSANDPERLALDPESQLGKIVRLDLASADAAPQVMAVGLRNPWRASYDATTGDLWVADVGQNLWEEINVVPFDQVDGASFGWSALEGTAPFNDDQVARHAAHVAIDPIYTYPHENDECSISGGFVYRGDEIPHAGTWYLFTDFCSGLVRALCVDGAKSVCGVIELGTVPSPVGILPDESGRPWVLSLDGRLVPIVPAS